MASQTSHRRNLAPSLSQQPKTSMDPTVPKKHPTPKSNPTSTTTTTATNTIKNISHHFAKLYAGHKAGLLSRSHPHVDIHLQTKKGLSNSTVFDTSCVALTKSNSHHGRRPSAAAALADVGGKVSTRTKVKEKDKKSLVKKSSPSLPTQNLEVDVEKAVAKQKFNEAAKISEGLLLLPEEDDLKKEFEELKRCDDEASEMRRESISNGGGDEGKIIRSRRKSFCCSQIELADFLSCSGVKVVAVDMPPFMQIHAVDCARKAYDSLEKFTSKNLALTLKKEFDGVYGPAWHCIVGTGFGSFVTHSVGGFLYFSMDQKLYILLFKTTVQRASD